MIVKHIANIFSEGELEEKSNMQFLDSLKFRQEYKKYQQKTLSEAEKNYLESLKALENKTKKGK